MLHPYERHELQPRKPYPKSMRPGKRPLRMTLIAAFRCVDGIVICADSQETLTIPPSGDERYRCKVNKLIPQSNGYYDWVASGAGNDGDLIDGFIDRLKDDFAAWPASLPGGAIKERLRESLLDYNRNEVATSGLSEPLQFLLCVKAKSGSEPLLFKLFSAVTTVDDWAMIGWEEAIYRHDIQRHYSPTANTSFSMLIGVHVLSLAKNTSNYVGGPLRVVVADSTGLHVLSEQQTEELEKRVADFDSALDALRLRICDTAVPLDDFSNSLSDFRQAVINLRISLTVDIAQAIFQRVRGVTEQQTAIQLLDDPYLRLPSPEECLRALRAAWIEVTKSRKTKRTITLAGRLYDQDDHGAEI